MAATVPVAQAGLQKGTNPAPRCYGPVNEVRRASGPATPRGTALP